MLPQSQPKENHWPFWRSLSIFLQFKWTIDHSGAWCVSSNSNPIGLPSRFSSLLRRGQRIIHLANWTRPNRLPSKCIPSDVDYAKQPLIAKHWHSPNETYLSVASVATLLKVAFRIIEIEFSIKFHVLFIRTTYLFHIPVFFLLKIRRKTQKEWKEKRNKQNIPKQWGNAIKQVKRNLWKQTK